MKGIFTRLREKRLKQDIDKELPKKEEPKEQAIEEPQEKKTGLRDQINEINEKLGVVMQEKKVEKNLKKKNFRLPYNVKSKLKKIAMKHKVQAIVLQNNGNIKPTIADIKNGMLVIGDKLYDGSPTGLWLWDGKFPTMIVPEWDLRPISRESLYPDAVKNKRLADPQTIIIRGMEVKELLQDKKMLGGKGLIWIGIGAIVVFYVLFAGG